MVRFIIVFLIVYNWFSFVIYIPIWLDLLLKEKNMYEMYDKNLHSNMVRFIIFNFII